MKSQRRPLQISLFLSLLVFGTLLYFNAHDRGIDDSGPGVQLSYGLQLDMKWVGNQDQGGFATLQDTLHRAALRLAETSGASSSRLEIDHCCEELLEGADFYRMNLAMAFDEPEDSLRLISSAIALGLVIPESSQLRGSMASGTASLHLPHAHAKALHLDGIAYELYVGIRQAERVHDVEPS